MQKAKSFLPLQPQTERKVLATGGNERAGFKQDKLWKFKKRFGSQKLNAELWQPLSKGKTKSAAGAFNLKEGNKKRPPADKAGARKKRRKT